MSLPGVDVFLTALLALAPALAGKPMAITSVDTHLCTDPERTDCWRPQPFNDLHGWWVVSSDDDTTHLRALPARFVGEPPGCVDGLPSAWPGVEVYVATADLIPVATAAVTLTSGETFVQVRPGQPLQAAEEEGLWSLRGTPPTLEGGGAVQLKLAAPVVSRVVEHRPVYQTEILQLDNRPGSIYGTLLDEPVVFTDVPWMWHLTGYTKKKKQWYLAMSDRCSAYRVAVDGKLGHSPGAPAGTPVIKDGDIPIPAGTEVTWVEARRTAGKLTQEIHVSRVEALPKGNQTCWQRAVGFKDVSGFASMQVCIPTSELPE